MGNFSYQTVSTRIRITMHSLRITALLNSSSLNYICNDQRHKGCQPLRATLSLQSRAARDVIPSSPCTGIPATAPSSDHYRPAGLLTLLFLVSYLSLYSSSLFRYSSKCTPYLCKSWVFCALIPLQRASQNHFYQGSHLLCKHFCWAILVSRVPFYILSFFSNFSSFPLESGYFLIPQYIS